jgi:hypothetical protein
MFTVSLQRQFGADSEYAAEDFSAGEAIKFRIYSFDISIERAGKRNTKVTVIQKQVVYYYEKYTERSKRQRELVIKKQNR